MEIYQYWNKTLWNIYRQGLSQDLETECPKLAKNVFNFLGIWFFRVDHNTQIIINDKHLLIEYTILSICNVMIRLTWELYGQAKNTIKHITNISCLLVQLKMKYTSEKVGYRI